jgi:hypothetical protein
MKTKFRNKKMRALICMLTIMIWIMATAVPAMAAPSVKEAEYEGNGRVEVEFKTKVSYKDLKVTVKDSKGKTYTAKIIEKDNDDLTFVIKGYKTGRTYTYTISGIKKKSESKYGKLTGKVTIPAAITAPKVKKVKYDAGDKEVEFKFTTHVEWKSPKVTISDGKNNYVVKILEKDDDEIEVKVKNLTKGKKYNYKITGIKIKGNNAYKTITGTFKAK